MASGDTLLEFVPQSNAPPLSSYATPDTRGSHPVLDFDKDSTEQAIFVGVMPRHYGNGGVTVYIHWSADGVTTGDVRWDVAFERVGDGQHDVDSPGFGSVNSVTDTAPGTDGFVTICNVSFTDGADMESVAVGEKFRISIQRDHDHADDDMAADAELHAVEIKET